MNNKLIYLALATALATNPLLSLEAKTTEKYRQSSLELAKVSERLTSHKRKTDNTNRNSRMSARNAYLAISDSNLRSCVKSKVLQTGINYADELTQLFCSGKQIASLAGLEPFTGLTFIDLGYNNISNITPLANLANLTHAMLWQNQISDISTLATWPSLYETDLTRNPITDVSALNQHPSLTRLFIGDSGYTISDLSPISSVNQLQWLGLFDNQLTDTNFTLGLNNLQLLDLRDNPISDISALSQLSNLNELGLMFSQVSDLSPVLTLNYSFNWIGLYGTPSVYCWQQDYAQNQANIGFFEASSQCDASTDYSDFDNDGIPNTYEVMQGSDPFGPIAPPTQLLFTDAINMLSDPQLQACLNQVHSQTPYQYANELTQLNCNMHGISSLGGIENFANLNQLQLANNQINQVVALNTLSQLHTLDLTDNNIQDISPLTQLTALNELALANNPVSDMSTLGQLTNLQVLDMADTPLYSASHLVNLTALTSLNISGAGLTDANPLAALVNLNTVIMDYNNIHNVAAVIQLSDSWAQLSFSEQTYCWQLDYVEAFMTVNTWQRPFTCDFSDNYNDFDNDGIANADEILMASNPFIAGPPPALSYNNALAYITDGALYSCLVAAKQTHQLASDLTELYCMGQNINNIIGLEHFTGLTRLDLGNNNLTDISPISSLTGLQSLFLPTNNIVDISPLAALNQLTELWLFENNISDISPLGATSALQEAVLAFNPISDVSALTTLSQLTHVDLNQTPVMSLSGFENLSALQYLDITFTGISDISPLANANNLEYLLAGDTQVVDFSPVIALPNSWVLLIVAENTYCWQVEYITTSVTVSNFNPPTNCDGSDDFNDFDNDGIANFDEVIQGRDPFNADLPPPPATIIEGINALTDGYLANCIFNAESSHLNNPIESLQVIICNAQNINQLEGVGHFSGLRLLDIGNNNITSIEPLRGLNQLETLFSDGNPISSIAAISELPALFDIGLSHSTMADVSQLFTGSNLWQALSFSEHNYCWQVSYADNALNLGYFSAQPSCDQSDDLNDFDNDGINNISEVNQGSSPFTAN